MKRKSFSSHFSSPWLLESYSIFTTQKHPLLQGGPRAGTEPPPCSRSSRHQNPHIVLPAQPTSRSPCYKIVINQPYSQGSISKHFLNTYFTSSLLHFTYLYIQFSPPALGRRTRSFHAAERKKPGWWRAPLCPRYPAEQAFS